MVKLLKIEDFIKLNEAFQEVSVKNWATLSDAVKELGNDQLLDALEKALKMKAEKMVHASDKDDMEGVGLFLDMIENELARKIRTVQVDDIKVDIYEMVRGSLVWFAYFPMKVNGKPTDNIVISEVALDKLN